ncbi:uncharacterized protein LOC130789132 [Actinidia eriantha]|uniref:uncharacterized protein LOC130789132 n=1 Tax=Actinidia eriantha TaxID=165200 RepID=UPI00258D2986|nr:uncharacterized protein LOC130789132 [Actinidia eriantha]
MLREWKVVCDTTCVFCNQPVLLQALTLQNRTASIHATKEDSTTTLMNTSAVHVAQTSHIHLRIQQAKNHAVAQAQQEGCMSNFRIFDSPFGNFLVPAIPTRAELGDGI